jgi:hypothetical protein
MPTTRTQEIRRDDWPRFFDAFSRRRQGWLAHIQVLGEEFGSQVEGHSLPLDGISVDFKAAEDSISISLVEAPDAHITRIVNMPTHVRLEQTVTEGGTIDTLQIVAASGETTLVQLPLATVPELADLY